MQPLAPSRWQNSNLSSLETTATGTAPASRAIWIAMEPRPPEPPPTRTTSPSLTVLGDQWCSMRYAVAPTSVGAAAASQVSCGALARHWCACTFANCANDPQFVSYTQILNKGLT